MHGGSTAPTHVDICVLAILCAKYFQDLSVPKRLRTLFSNAVAESQVIDLPCTLSSLGFHRTGGEGPLFSGRPSRAVLHLCGRPAGRCGIHGRVISFDVSYQPR